MMQYSFEPTVDRSHTDALKVDALQARFGRADLIPLWVADMCLSTPPFIIDAIKQRAEHPIFGYTQMPEGYWEEVAKWIKHSQGWETRPEWMTFIPGIVRGIGLAINIFTSPGDKVIIQPPVYHPFRMVTEGNGRIAVDNPLVLQADGYYAMDFEQLESIIDERCKMLVLSNPHNPAGIVWDESTLRRLADICDRHNIIVISDEIHADMPLFGHKHIPFASVSEAAARCSITFGAPSKTFNMAGIVSSWAIVPNETLRTKFYTWLTVNELNEPHLLAPIATLAALREGDEWRKQMLHYVEENIQFVEDFLATHIPAIKPLRPQASFLVWLDCRDLGLAQSELAQFFINEARLALNDGAMFGQGGEGFMRINVGTSRQTLEKAMHQLEDAVQRLQKQP